MEVTYICIVGHTSNDDIREGIGTDLGNDSAKNGKKLLKA